MEKAYFNWSSGKDSAMALYYALRSGKYDIQTLFTTVKKDGARVAMHEIGIDLLRKQAQALGLPLTVLEYQLADDGESYRAAMARQIERLKSRNIRTALFGDLYLEELRKNREKHCRQSGIKAAFPLWGMDAKALLSEFVKLGFKSIVTCVNASALDERFAGRVIDEAFIRDLPPGVDICGENGEYHSFVFDGPIFSAPVPFEIGRKYCKAYPGKDGTRLDKYWYVELI